MTKTMPHVPQQYQIRIAGELPTSWADYFNGLLIAKQVSSDGLVTTTLTGLIVDQAALHGILTKIGDLNLKLIAVTELDQTCQTR